MRAHLDARRDRALGRLGYRVLRVEGFLSDGDRINSVRYAAAGRDAATGICASIIWDYSNNDLDVSAHCDDFLTYPSFPHVLVSEPPASCDPLQSFWDYGGAEPHFASGCFDPGAELVDVSVEVSFNGTNYLIVANNTP